MKLPDQKALDLHGPVEQSIAKPLTHSERLNIVRDQVTDVLTQRFGEDPERELLTNHIVNSMSIFLLGDALTHGPLRDQYQASLAFGEVAASQQNIAEQEVHRHVLVASYLLREIADPRTFY